MSLLPQGTFQTVNATSATIYYTALNTIASNLINSSASSGTLMSTQLLNASSGIQSMLSQMQLGQQVSS